MHWSVSGAESKSLSSGKPPRRGWPSLQTPYSQSFLLSYFPGIFLPSHLIYSLNLLLLLPPSFVLFMLWSPFDPRSFFPSFFPPKSFLISSLHLHFHLWVFLSLFCSLPPQPVVRSDFPVVKTAKPLGNKGSKSKESAIEERTKRDRQCYAADTWDHRLLHCRSTRLSGRGQRNWLALYPLLSEWY